MSTLVAFPTPQARESYKPDPAKKVAIVGFASSSRHLVPWDDKTFECWGLNSLYAMIPRWDRWFEIHPRAHIAKNLQRAELLELNIQHEQWIKDQPGPGQEGFRPIYMQDHYPDIPASVRWPREQINAWATAMFGPEAELDYFTSTPGEMMAQAVYEGFGEIHLYGIDLLQHEEYAYQRPGCEYWIGIARGLGIKVVIPSSSALCKASYVYGYSEPPTDYNSVVPLAEFFSLQNTKIEQAQHQMAGRVNAIQGARQAFGRIAEKIAAGESIEALKEECQKQEKLLTEQFETGKESLVKMGAQREFATSAASWTQHYGRGGLLEGMTTNVLAGTVVAASS